MKLINKSPEEMEKIGQIYKNLKILQVTLDGRDDYYYNSTTTQGSIYNLVKSENSYVKLPYFSKLFSLAKKLIEDRLMKEFGIQV